MAGYNFACACIAVAYGNPESKHGGQSSGGLEDGRSYRSGLLGRMEIPCRFGRIWPEHRGRTFDTVGSALAITVGHRLWALHDRFLVVSQGSANVMNALFHGLDFSPLKRDGTFTFASFVYGFTVLVVWAFLMGAVFGWIAERLLGLGEAAVVVKPRMIP